MDLRFWLKWPDNGFSGIRLAQLWSPMRCPYCHLDEDRVLDTRTAEGGYLIRRRRVCTNCNRRFGTIEKIEQLTLRVVKRDETREPLDREKIRRGIERACSK
ncbi:MAG: transcriptional repressor NrdR, partial [Planctomycetales bacterium]|nr:transcriptional repressor NrdR [Planctomycetales bacterium]